MLFKKKRTIIPEPPGYSPEEFGLELPSIAKSSENFLFEQEKQSKPKEFSEIIEEKKLLKSDLKKPVFIRIENFKEIVETILSIGKRLQELEEIISKLEEIKQKEAEKLEEWREEIQELKEQLKVLEKNFSTKL
ncbi:MAG: hypothetical protein QXW65_01785 [Candidatus Pacearchaeota archaeon]